MNDHDFINLVLKRRPPHVAPGYTERQRLAAIYDGLTGYGAVLSGLNRLRTQVPPEIAQRILILQEDLVKWERENAGTSGSAETV